MKNRKMSTTITVVIFFVITICISLLYIIANTSMTAIMRNSELQNLHEDLNVQTNIIKEYIDHQEDMLIAYSNTQEVIEFLKEPDNDEKKRTAQKHTEKYYKRLNNWEGLYIAEWNTHIIAHSSSEYIGMTTREGDSLKELQNEIALRKDLYNVGIIESPATGKLILSLYCPVFDYDGKTILGYVGGGPFADELKRLISSVENDSAKYYMINVPSKKYIFAGDESLMSNEIQDKMLLSITENLLENKTTWTGDEEYYDETVGKSIAAYQYIPKYKWAVVSCNSEENIFADVTKNMKILRFICFIFILVTAVLCWIFIWISTRPLKTVEKSIVKLQHLNLDEGHNLDKYINGKSEIGQIATAIDSLYDSIKDMLNAEKEKQVAIAASESKERFLASMSHEIRTPINTILGMNEMILRENEDETIEEYSNNIKSASEMLLSLINDILDFSKLESGKFQIIENDYRITSVVSAVVTGIEVRAKQKGLKLDVNVDKDMPAILHGDEIRIKQILNNLLSNAIKYTEKGRITFEINGIKKENEFMLQMKVTDTGIGMKQHEMNHLFDSFERLEKEKTRHIEGTGLGLNITKQLVENMNGTIDVKSEYGIGSSFTVVLPQKVMSKSTVEMQEQRYKQSEIVKDAESKYLYAPNAKVLVVDDNKMNLKVIQGLLKRSKIQLDCVTGGNECLKMTKTKKYDLILMDHMMPELDGIQTLHLLRKDKDNVNNETNVIVLTANAISGSEDKYLKEGFVGYLSKPIVVGKMEEMLSKYLIK